MAFKRKDWWLIPAWIGVGLAGWFFYVELGWEVIALIVFVFVCAVVLLVSSEYDHNGRS